MRRADVHLPRETIAEMGFDRSLDGLGEAAVRDLTLLRCDGAASVVVATYDEAVDDALARADQIERFERVDSDGNGVTYLQRVVAPALPRDAPAPGDRGVTIRSVNPGEDGCTVTMVGDGGSLRDQLRLADAAGLSLSLERLTDFTGPDPELAALTDRQREVLETAHALGYYDVPRGATAADVARELDLDRSTVTEHLQRAEGKIVESLLSG